MKVVGALLRYLYNDAVLFSDVTIDLMTIADKYDLKALFNRCDFYIAQALRSCQLTGEDVKVNVRLLQFKTEGRSGYLVEIQCVLNKTSGSDGPVFYNLPSELSRYYR